MHSFDALPPITMSCTDFNELVFALGFAAKDENAAFLAQELQRAVLCRPDDVPDDVVALNCRVIFQLQGDRRVHASLLVNPHNLLRPAMELSALSPVGAALIGLRAGDVMPFVEDGERREVSVEAVGMRFIGTA